MMCVHLYDVCLVIFFHRKGAKDARLPNVKDLFQSVSATSAFWFVSREKEGLLVATAKLLYRFDKAFHLIGFSVWI
jgi:hypothetical protein